MYRTKNGSLEYGKDNVVTFVIKIGNFELAREAISNGEQFLEKIIPGCSTVVTNSGEDGKPGAAYGISKENKDGFETQRDRGDDEVWQLVSLEEGEEITSFEYRAQVGKHAGGRDYRVVVELGQENVKIFWSDNPVLLSCVEMTDLVSPLFCLVPVFRKREKTQMDKLYLDLLEKIHKYVNEYDPALYPNRARFEEVEEENLKGTL